MSVGLDIGSKTLKVVELAEEKSGWRLISSGIVANQSKLPGQIIDEKDFLTLAEVIRKLYKEVKIGAKEVNIALPESLVFTRSVRFPLLDNREIASAVKWETEQYIPIPIAEAIVQYQIIEKNDSAAKPESLILLVATPKNLVEKYVKAVQMAGLNVVGVETQLLALVRSLAPAEGTVLLMDFGARTTDIAIAKDGNLSFSRSIPTAGETFTRALVQGLGIEYQQAEEYKKTYGLSDELEEKVKKTLNPVLAMVTEEIKKAVYYYQSEEKGTAPQSVIVSGGSSRMPEVIASLTNLLGLEVVVGDPFAKIIVDQEVKKSIEAYSPLYSIAVGLAMRGE